MFAFRAASFCCLALVVVLQIACGGDVPDGPPTDLTDAAAPVPSDGGVLDGAVDGGGDGSLPGPGPIAFKPICSATGFCWVNPLPQGNALHGIYGASASDVWAVGDHGTILHFDGTTWEQVASPVVTNLNGIHGASAKDIFAVGDAGTILHFDGTTWSKVPSPVTNQLNVVWIDGKGDGFCAGYLDLLRLRGGSWQKHTSPPSGLNTYQRLWASSANDVWLGAAPGGLFHFDGTLFTRYAPLASENYIRSIVGFAPNDVWVGAGGRLMRVRDGKLSEAYVEEAGHSFVGVFGSGPNDVWATSYKGGDGQHLFRHHFDGKEWRSAAIEPFFIVDAGYSTRPGETWVVGLNGYLARADSSGAWTRVGSGFGAAVNSLYPAGPNEAWSVSKDLDRPLQHFDGTTWTYPSLGVNIEFDAVSGAAPNDLWITGSATFHFDGKGWTSRGNGGDYTSIWTTGPDTWALFSRKLHRYSGLAWGAITDGRTYIALAGSARDNVWAMASNGGDSYTAYRWDGTSFSSTTALFTKSPSALYPVAAKDLWVATWNGRVARWDGTAWTSVDVDPATYEQPSICGSRGEIWLAHGGRTFVRRASSFTEVETGTANGALSITCRDGAVWLAGNGGMVLKKN